MQSKLAELLQYSNLNVPASIQDVYDPVALDFKNHKPPFLNFGHWDRDTRTQYQASEKLMGRFVEGINRHSHKSNEGIRILDVACGLGATTKYIKRHFPTASVHGINVTEKQVEAGRRNAPECTFSVMNANKLNFEEERFDYVFCVEAAFQFDTRASFLKEAFRTLKEGGILCMTDVLLHKEAHGLPHLFSTHYPAVNYLPTLGDYETAITTAGFELCEMEDITREGSRRSCDHLVGMYYKMWSRGEITYRKFLDNLNIFLLLESIININLFCLARKPKRP